MTENINGPEEGGVLPPVPDAPPRAVRGKKKSSLPEWAQIQSDISEDETIDDAVEQTPPAVGSPFGKKPSNQPAPAVTPTPVQVPSTPTAVPTPVQEVKKPARPAKPQSVPTSAPVPTPVQAPSTPTAVPTPVSETPVQPPMTQQTPVQAPLLQPTVIPEYTEAKGFPQAEPIIEQSPLQEFTNNDSTVEPPKKKSRSKANIFSNFSNEGRSTGQPESWEPVNKKAERKRKNAGGRWKLLAVRYGVFGVMALIVILGFVKLVSPIPVADIATQVQASLGYNGFPITRGQQMAARFTATYLEYSQDARQQRENSLLQYLSPNAPTDFVKSSSEIPGYHQSILDGPYLAVPADLTDPTHVSFTYVALVANNYTGTKDINGNIIQPQWVYLTVPMGADEKKNVAVVGPPAFVPAPEKAGKIAELPFKVDDKATESAKKTVQDYMVAWAASTPESPVSAQYLRKGESTYAAQVGLSGKVSTTSTGVAFAVAALEDGADPATAQRTANVTVTWKTAEGLSYSQKYRLTMVYVDQYWYILDVKGGNYSSY